MSASTGFGSGRLFDCDGDGDLDIANNASADMTAATNDGTGTFTPVTGVSCQRFDLILPEIDGDPSTLEWYSTLPVGGSYGQKYADVNGDGTWESLWHDTAKRGGFEFQGGLPVQVGTVTTNSNYGPSLYGDINNDGVLDFFGWGTGVVYHGKPFGNFETRSLPRSPSGYSVLLDFDGDGDLDVLAGTLGTIFMMVNDGSGNFTVQDIPSETVPADFVQDVGDVDGDGDLDILTRQGRVLKFVYVP